VLRVPVSIRQWIMEVITDMVLNGQIDRETIS
jgi:hypothetical protein